MNSVAALGSRLSHSRPLARVARWLDAMPHPAVACEIAAAHVAGARWGRVTLDGFAVETLPEGAVVPSPVEPNLAAPDAARVALGRVLDRIGARGQALTLLVPDQVVRVFLLRFETFPRRPEDAIPLLRWRLKKSVPFDVEDTVVSYLPQPVPASATAAPGGPPKESVDVLAAVARQRIVRQYEELVEAAGAVPGVVISSTLATLPLLEDGPATLLARMSGTTLTTVIVRGELLCVYRCTEMPADASLLQAQALLDEIYPAVTFYQDTWREGLEQVRLAGLGARYDEFRRAVELELSCGVAPLMASGALLNRVTGDARSLMDRQLDALVGWMMNRGA